jgi:aspartyl-tRNA(Asn)/glutamyl-tRNA(Gln) amidotransferase subunit B
MRVKEGSSDYRYFTEPDLVPMAMSPEWVAQVRDRLPELPADRRARYMSQGLDAGTAVALSNLDGQLKVIYDEAVLAGAPARAAANWLIGEVVGWLRKSDSAAGEIVLTGADLAELVAMVEEGAVSTSAAKDVLDGVLSGEGPPRDVAGRRDLLQLSDVDVLEAAVEDVLAAHPQARDDLLAGEEKALGFLVGQVMKATQGKADPRAVNRLLRDRTTG